MKVRIFALATCVAIAGCNGGSHATAVLPQPQRQTSSASARIVIRIPAATAQGKKPAYVSPSTQSISVALVPAASCAACTPALTITSNLTPASAGCTTTGGATTCSIPISLNPGSYTGSVTTYDGLNQNGNVLTSNQSVPFTIAADVDNTISLTLSGIAASLALSLSGTQNASLHGSTLLVDGAGSTARVSVTIKDADGNAIVGPGAPGVTVTETGASYPIAYNSAHQQITVTTPARATRADATITASVAGCATCSAQLLAYITPIVAILDIGSYTISVLNTRTNAPMGTPLAIGSFGGSWAVGFDSKANLFFSDQTASITAIDEAAPPYAAVTNVTNIGTSGISPSNVTFDANDNMFISNNVGSVFSQPPVAEFAPPTYATAIPLQGAAANSNFAFSDSAGNLWVDDSTNHRLLRYASPVTATESPTTTLSNTNQTITEIVQYGNSIVLTDAGYGNIVQLDMSGNIQNSLHDPAFSGSLAVSPLGVLFAGSGPNLAYFQSLTVAPSISSSYDLINDQQALGIDSFGNLYIADQGHATSTAGAYVLAPPYTGTPQRLTGTYSRPVQLAVWP